MEKGRFFAFLGLLALLMFQQLRINRLESETLDMEKQIKSVAEDISILSKASINNSQSITTLVKIIHEIR